MNQDLQDRLRRLGVTRGARDLKTERRLPYQESLPAQDRESGLGSLPPTKGARRSRYNSSFLGAGSSKREPAHVLSLTTFTLYPISMVMKN